MKVYDDLIQSLRSEDFETIHPEVSAEAEFREISSNFGDPLEVLREAVSNAYDAGAENVHITFTVDQRGGFPTLILEIKDDGIGMSREILTRNFWDLGNSTASHDAAKIGEKGHGTKIYLRSERVTVITRHESGSFISVCENPFAALNEGRVHSPRIGALPESDERGTTIILEKYNNNEMSRYRQDIVTDYLYWFTKLGSFERELTGHSPRGITVHLQCLDVTEPKTLPFGHRFAEISSDLNALFEKHSANAAEHFAQKFLFSGTLPSYPYISYEAVVYVEGDKAKRAYNTMIRGRRADQQGYYKVADRYGIYLAKDYIPIQKRNEWVSGFGVGSNSYILLHGFINCQQLKLTANRGNIAADPAIEQELHDEVVKILDSIDEAMEDKGLYVLQDWVVEGKTREVEAAEFNRRKESIAKRAQYRCIGTNGERILLEPNSESELFGLFTSLYSLYPDEFPFEPLDYNTNRGIDVIARNKSTNPIADCEYWYIELKYILGANFNHSFDNIRWIVCWDFDSSLRHDSILKSAIEGEERILQIEGTKDSREYYLRKAPTGSRRLIPDAGPRITIIRLKELMEKLPLAENI